MVEYERFEPDDRRALRSWLAKHHRRSPGLWLVLRKGPDRIPYEDVCEELICFGWVDSRPRKLDDTRSMLLCTPRSLKAAWSAHNKRRVQKLLGLGLIEPAGLAIIEASKANGRWTALEQADAMTVPEDLRHALASRPPARSHFDAFPPGVRRQLLEWVLLAKKPETRAKRIDELARKAQKNERANQWRPKAHAVSKKA